MFFLLLKNVNIIKKRECQGVPNTTDNCFLSQCKHLSLNKTSKYTTFLVMGIYHPDCSENINRQLLPAIFQMYFWLCDVVVLHAFKVRKCWFYCLENWSHA